MLCYVMLFSVFPRKSTIPNTLICLHAICPPYFYHLCKLNIFFQLLISFVEWAPGKNADHHLIERCQNNVPMTCDVFKKEIQKQLQNVRVIGVTLYRWT